VHFAVLRTDQKIGAEGRKRKWDS